MPDFNQLAPLMQEVGHAVFKIERNHTARITDSGKPWLGNNWTQAEARMADYRGRFESLAKIVEAL